MTSERDDLPDESAYDDAEPPVDGGADDGGLSAELEAVRAERDALYEKLARAQADFTNSRRRLENDARQTLQLSLGRAMKALLPVVDNLERALALDPAKIDAAAVLDGVRGTHAQFLDALRGQGVESLAPEPGTPFDPTTMEALMQEPGDHPEPTVTRLLQPGYTHQGRPLRPAQVAVSKK